VDAPAIVAPGFRGEPVANPSGCLCNERFELEADHHSWLLSVESRGFAGVVDLMTYLEVDFDCERTVGQVRYLDFADFVAMHNWDDPVRMVEFAQTMADLLRLRDRVRGRDL
jgi:hypothetical protein